MKPIIVGTDFSEGSNVALDVAVDIANRLQTEILLVWVKREKLLFTGEQLDMMSKLAKEKLEALCTEFGPRMKYGKIRNTIASGRVAGMLAEIAKKENAPMIVVGTNGASGFEKYMIGSQAARIVQDAPCPVLTIRQGYDSHKKLERIVVPIRVNENSRQKVPPAAGMARLFDSTVHILGLYEMKADEPTLRTYVQQSEDYMRKEGVRFEVEYKKYSNYCDTVLEYADGIAADLIVINTEQKIISQLFLGTNAQQIVHRSQMPVLSIHPEDYINIASKV